MEEKHGLVKTYMRYSKRIVIVSLIGWMTITATIIGLLYWLALGRTALDEYVASVLRTILSSSSGVTIATVGAYYVHSGAENITAIQQKIKTLTSIGEDQQNNDEVGGVG